MDAFINSLVALTELVIYGLFWGFIIKITKGTARKVAIGILIVCSIGMLFNGIGIALLLTALPSFLVVAAGLAVVYFIGAASQAKEKKYIEDMINAWLAIPARNMTESELEDIIIPFVSFISENDQNGKKFDMYSIPYGRASNFLNYYNKSVDIESPLYYSPIRSLDDVELREYGFLLTNGGIYIAKQSDKTDKNKNHIVSSTDLSFNGLMSVNYDKENNKLTAFYATKRKAVLYQGETTLPLGYIFSLLSTMIDTGASRSMYLNMIYKDNSMIPAGTAVNGDLLDRRFAQSQAMNTTGQVLRPGEAVVNTANIQQRFDSFGNVMNASRGAGYAAEIANDTIDRLNPFNKVEYVGQQKDASGKIIKNGADRIVNGVNIQTKYCATGNDCINAAFDKNGNAKYLNPDGSMMQIEVPSDSDIYYDACAKMEKKIAEGKVPGAKPGDAKKYVRRGLISYRQSHNIAKAGCVESLAIDALNGVIASSEVACISALITFASAVWNGMEAKEAAKASLQTYASVLGRAALNAMIIGQLSKKDIALIFLKQGKTGFQTVANPIYKLGDKMASKISSTALAKSSVGQSLKLNAVDGAKLISGTIVFAITFGPDICRALVGRISPKQLFKNSCVGAAGIVGGVIGNSIVPVLGGLVGAAIGGFIAKRTLDNFIEDDAKEMYQILKEEFLDVVMIAGLTQTEFEDVINLTFTNKKLPHMLRDMYQYGDSREYAREQIISTAVQNVYSKRQRITEDMFKKAFIDLSEDEYEDMDTPEPAAPVSAADIQASMPTQQAYQDTINAAVSQK